MKRKSLIFTAIASLAFATTSCFVDGGSSAKDNKIEVLENELDSIKANPTVVRDTIKVREKIESSAELTDEAKQLLNELAE